MITTDTLTSPQQQTQDVENSIAHDNIRPKTLASYTGQKAVTEPLKLFIEAAKARQESLDHVLIFGPPP